MSVPGQLDDAPAAPRRRLFVLVPLAIFALLAALFLARLFSGDPQRLPSALIGKPAPTFVLPPLEGLTREGQAVPGLSTEALRGRVTLVNIWASWCAPCREEHPLLVELAKDPSVTLVGINYKDQPDNARRFLGALGNPFAAVGADANGRAAIDWGVYGVPETFVIAPDGTIAYKHVGPLTAQAIASGPFRDAITAAASKKGG